MVLVYIKVPRGFNRQVYARVTCYLIEHVVKKSESGADVTLSASVEIDGYVYPGLGCVAFYGGFACASLKYGYNLVP